MRRFEIQTNAPSCPTGIEGINDEREDTAGCDAAPVDARAEGVGGVRLMACVLSVTCISSALLE